MNVKPRTAQMWSLRRKILILTTIIIFILALALGLALGLAFGRDDNDNGNPSTPTSALTPVPSPNTTISWTPSVSDTWQIILSHPPVTYANTSITPNVTVFDIDLFDTPVETIRNLHNMGKKVICYFSAGSYESWRTDAGEFEKEDLGHDLNGWPGEKWLKLGSQNVRRIMKNRINMAKEKGCDGVDPDNVDAYQNDNGLSLTQQDSVSYIAYLSSLTTPLNLALGLKNAGDIIPAVLPIVHFSVNEECVKYSECALFAAFVDAGKPVFHIEYPDRAGAGQALQEDTVRHFCKREGQGEGSQGFSTVLKKLKLDGWVEYCDMDVEITDLDESLGNHG